MQFFFLFLFFFFGGGGGNNVHYGGCESGVSQIMSALCLSSLISNGGSVPRDCRCSRSRCSLFHIPFCKKVTATSPQQHSAVYNFISTRENDSLTVAQVRSIKILT